MRIARNRYSRGEQRHRDVGEGDQRDDEDAVLRDREQLLVRGVGRLELAVFAVDHGAPLDPVDVPLAEQSLGRHSSTGAPARRRTSPRCRRHRSLPYGPEVDLGELLAHADDSPPMIAPGIEVKPPRITTGSALSATSCSENCTPSFEPHTTPATSATSPATRPHDDPDAVQRDARSTAPPGGRRRPRAARARWRSSGRTARARPRAAPRDGRGDEILLVDQDAALEQVFCKMNIGSLGMPRSMS